MTEYMQICRTFDVPRTTMNYIKRERVSWVKEKRVCVNSGCPHLNLNFSGSALGRTNKGDRPGASIIRSASHTTFYAHILRLRPSVALRSFLLPFYRTIIDADSACRRHKSSFFHRQTS